MKKESQRINKINKIIQKKISEIINNNIYEQKNNIITITKVITNKDISISKIFLTIFKNEKEVLEIMNNNSKIIRKELSSELKIYKTPKLIFILDTQNKEIEKIDQLIESTKKKCKMES